jgi:hypothetical protein
MNWQDFVYVQVALQDALPEGLELHTHKLSTKQGIEMLIVDIQTDEVVFSRKYSGLFVVKRTPSQIIESLGKDIAPFLEVWNSPLRQAMKE